MGCRCTGHHLVDPLPADIIRTPPAIGFTVATMKFQGASPCCMSVGLDLYAVELHRDGELIERVDEVFFDTLGETLERLIDDGSWRRIRVQCLLSGSQGCPALISSSFPPFAAEASSSWRSHHDCSIQRHGAAARARQAVANQCRVILVRIRGVYFLAECGERRPMVARRPSPMPPVATGCRCLRRLVELARAEFGGDDFGEFFDPQEGVFARILRSEDDLDVSATTTHLSLQAVPSRPAVTDRPSLAPAPGPFFPAMRTAASADCRFACAPSWRHASRPCSADVRQRHAQAATIFKAAMRFRPR